MEADAQVVGDLGEPFAYVACGSEPESTPVDEAGGAHQLRQLAGARGVDPQRLGKLSGLVVGVVTTEDRVGFDIGVQRGPKVVHEVAGREAQQDLAAFRGDARTAGAPTASTFLEQILTSGHAIHRASERRGSDRGTIVHPSEPSSRRA
ncbi:MAG TPA: hypothetical protein VLR27_12640 [Acidimicrobiales bacterium]|nr:hypothetical protein [Acidimicrobiales bacterium]